MAIDFKKDKRITALINKEDKYYLPLFDLYTITKDEATIPVMIEIPNIVALLLNISDVANERASKILNDLEETMELVPVEKGKCYKFKNDTYNLREYDMLENLFVSIVFACSAVEAFVNNLIPIDFNYGEPKNKNEKTAVLISSKEYIERNYSLDHKINKILPLIYSFDEDSYKNNQSDKACWDKFVELIKHRDRIVHPKIEKTKLGKFSQIKFLADIFHSGFNTELVKSSRELIKNLCEKIKQAPMNVRRSPHIPLEFLEHEATLQDYETF